MGSVVQSLGRFLWIEWSPCLVQCLELRVEDAELVFEPVGF